MLRKLCATVILSTVIYAGEMTIFAASDLKFALDTIKSRFLQTHPNDTIRMIYGSSGKGRVQVANGAPYDLYFSANMDYVQQLYKNGDIVTEPKLYAIGRLVESPVARPAMRAAQAYPKAPYERAGPMLWRRPFYRST